MKNKPKCEHDGTLIEFRGEQNTASVSSAMMLFIVNIMPRGASPAPPSPARCRQLRRSLTVTAAGSDQTPLGGRLGNNKPPEEGEEEQAVLEKALGGPAFAPPGATSAGATSAGDRDQPAPMYADDVPQPDADDALLLSTGANEPAAAKTIAGRQFGPSGGTTRKGGARGTFSRAAARKSVRFEEGTVGGEPPVPPPGSPPRSPLGWPTPIRASDSTPAGSGEFSTHEGRSPRKHPGETETRNWKGLPSAGTPSYGSIDVDSASDDDEHEEGGRGWDEEVGREPSGAGISRTTRRSFHSDSSRDASVFGGGAGGGAGGGRTHSDALLGRDYEREDSPGSNHGWRSRVSKWYHDF